MKIKKEKVQAISKDKKINSINKLVNKCIFIKIVVIFICASFMQNISYAGDEKDKSDIESEYLTSIDMVLEILRKDKEISDYENTYKYIYYKYTGNESYKTELDFSAYDTSGFNDVNDGGNGGSSNLEGYDGVPAKIADFLLDKGMPIEGIAAVLGNIQQECGFNPKDTSGNYIGICQWGILYDGKPSRGTALKNYATKKGKDWTDLDIQIQYMWKELNGGYSDSKAKLMKAKDVASTTEYFARHYEACVNSDGSLQQLDKRQNYAQKWYNELKKKAETGSSSVNINTKLTGKKKEKMKKLIARAIEIANDVDYKYYTYSQANRFGEHSFDCSSFCARLYKKYFNISVPNSTRDYSSNGYVGSVGSVELQPGDILWRSGHVELYIGNNKRAGAHTHYPNNSKDDISIKEGGMNTFTKVYRFIK